MFMHMLLMYLTLWPCLHACALFSDYGQYSSNKIFFCFCNIPHVSGPNTKLKHVLFLLFSCGNIDACFFAIYCGAWFSAQQLNQLINSHSCHRQKNTTVQWIVKCRAWDLWSCQSLCKLFTYFSLVLSSSHWADTPLNLNPGPGACKGSLVSMNCGRSCLHLCTQFSYLFWKRHTVQGYHNWN